MSRIFLGNIKGPKGDPGPGVPAGGFTGDFLIKNSDADYDTRWYSKEIMELIESTAKDLNSEIESVTFPSITEEVESQIPYEDKAGKGIKFDLVNEKVTYAHSLFAQIARTNLGNSGTSDKWIGGNFFPNGYLAGVKARYTMPTAINPDAVRGYSDTIQPRLAGEGQNDIAYGETFMFFNDYISAPDSLDYYMVSQVEFDNLLKNASKPFETDAVYYLTCNHFNTSLAVGVQKCGHYTGIQYDSPDMIILKRADFLPQGISSYQDRYSIAKHLHQAISIDREDINYHVFPGFIESLPIFDTDSETYEADLANYVNYGIINNNVTWYDWLVTRAPSI